MKIKKGNTESFCIVMTHNLANFVFQLSKTEVQKREDEMLRLSLEPARTRYLVCVTGSSTRY